MAFFSWQFTNSTFWLLSTEINNVTLNKWIKVVNRKISSSSTKHPATATNNTEHKSGLRQVFSSIYHLHFNFTFHILEPNIEVVLKLDLWAAFGLTWFGCNGACTWGRTTARLNTRLSFLSVLTWHSYWPSSRGVTCWILHMCHSVTTWAWNEGSYLITEQLLQHSHLRHY